MVKTEVHTINLTELNRYNLLYEQHLTTKQLKQYFSSLIDTHSWSTVKLNRNGLQFFYRYTLDKQWEWLNIVKPPRTNTLPDMITPPQVALLISITRQRRYQVFFLTLYSMGLRLAEGLNLTINDIDAHTMRVHIREGKGGKDRLVPLPKRTLKALREHWKTHRHSTLIFPGKESHLEKTNEAMSRLKLIVQFTYIEASGLFNNRD